MKFGISSAAGATFQLLASYLMILCIKTDISRKGLTCKPGFELDVIYHLDIQ